MKSGVNLGMKYLFSVLKMYLLIENSCKIIWKFFRDFCDFWVSPETE